jgi:CheY-like chemotaxis protein
MWMSDEISSHPLPVPLALSSSTAENVKKGRILLVDDDPDITKTFGLVLEDSGLYEVDTYNDPLAALQNFKPNFYNLAILDIRMPNMNGFELFHKMERIDNKVKVCFISAYDMNDKALREQFPSMQIKSFLPKPIAVSDLIKKVETELLR